MLNKIKVSAVSYMNTIPFMRGIEAHPELLDYAEIGTDIPAVCAQKLIDDEVDLGLVPVAALLDIPDYHIIGDYCIGSIGAVNSVFIFSKKPIDEIRTLRLDSHSRTSNNLARVLLKNYWQVPVTLVDGEADAYVLIGDRTFGKAAVEPYAYDLGEAWMNFTRLPFAYAVWAANKKLSPTFIELFNKVLKTGIDGRESYIHEIPAVDNFDIQRYLMESIDYDLTVEKREAIQLFHRYIQELNAAVNNSLSGTNVSKR